MTGSDARDRVQRLAIGAAAAANKGRTLLMGTAMAVYIGEVGSPFAVSLVYAFYWFGLMAFSPVAGAIADVTGRRRAVLVGTAVLSTLSILPLTILDGVWGPLAFRAVFAVFAAGFLPVMLAIVSERGGATGRGQSVGFFNSAQAAGSTAGQFLAGVLLGSVAPGALYLFVAAVSAVVAVAGVFIRDPAPPREETPTAAEVAAEIRARLLPAAADRRHLRSHGLRWLYAAVLLRNMTVLGASSLLPVYLVSELGVTEFVMGVLLAINPAAQTAFMYVFGRVADDRGRKPLVVYGMTAAGVYALIMAAAATPEAHLARIAIAGGALLVLASAFSAETTGTYAFIGDVAPTDRESELMGLHSTARGVGGMLGPALLGAIATVLSFQAALAAGSLLAFAGAAVVVRLLVESRPADRPASAAAAED